MSKEVRFGDVLRSSKDYVMAIAADDRKPPHRSWRFIALIDLGGGNVGWVSAGNYLEEDHWHVVSPVEDTA